MGFSPSPPDGGPGPAARSAPMIDATSILSARILIVDDDRDTGDALAQVLRLHGFANVAAISDSQAVAGLHRVNRYDLIVLDIGMPGMDGFEVAQRVRKRSDFDQIVLIAMTGWGQAEDRNRSKTAGFDHHLVKPADIVTLQTLLISGGK